MSLSRRTCIIELNHKSLCQKQPPEDYTFLRKSFVIFICTYDPFGTDRYVYTFENRCREDLSIALGDEAMKIILNTKGRIGEITDELKDLLRYMDGFAPDSAYTKELDQAVAEVRTDEKWRREYMVLNEMLRENRRLGEYKTRVAQVRKFMTRYASDELAEIYIIQPEVVKAILEAIDAHPDWDDEQIAENIEV